MGALDLLLRDVALVYTYLGNLKVLSYPYYQRPKHAATVLCIARGGPRSASGNTTEKLAYHNPWTSVLQEGSFVAVHTNAIFLLLDET